MRLTYLVRESTASFPEAARGLTSRSPSNGLYYHIIAVNMSIGREPEVRQHRRVN